LDHASWKRGSPVWGVDLHPGVKDVALVGYPDGKGGELACAVVVPTAPGLTLAALRDYLS